MSGIKKALKAIQLILRNPVLLNRVLQEPDIWKNFVQNKYKMSGGLGVIDPSVLPGFERKWEIPVFTFLDGGSLCTDIALLKNLAAGFENCRYFEIGTWRGESALNVAEVAAEVFTLNLSEKELRDIGVSELSISQQDLFSKGKENIIHLKSDSRKFDFCSLNKKFDLIFIDGSHHFEDVKEDTKNVFRHLCHENSIVVWHDYAIHPESVRFEVLAGILDAVKPSDHQYLYHVGQTKSAVFIKKKYNSLPLIDAIYPTYYYSIDLKYQQIEK